MRRFRNLAIGAMLALAVPLEGAHAITECNVNIHRIFVGDGIIWISFTNGGQAVVQANDPDREATLSMAMTAFIAGREVIARYQADNLVCNSSEAATLIGLWLN